MVIQMYADDYQEDFYKLLREIVANLNLQPVDDDQIWSAAKEYKDVPNLANVALDLTAERIGDFCRDNHIDFESSINGMDSHIFINKEEIYDFDKFLDEAILSQAMNEDFIFELGQMIENKGSEDLDAFILVGLNKKLDIHFKNSNGTKGKVDYLLKSMSEKSEFVADVYINQKKQRVMRP